MHVALDGGDDDLALGLRFAAGRDVRRLLGLDVRHEVRHRLLHHARRLDHLRQEHLAGTEEVADDVHAVHQGPFDDLDRAAAARRDGGTALLGVFDDVVRDAMDQRVREALLHRIGTPCEVFLPLPAARLHLLRELHQPLAGIGPPVENDVLDPLAQFRLDVLVHAELARVDDAHRHAGADRVIKKDRVDRLAHMVIAAKTEADVADAAADLGVGQVVLDPARGLDEIHRVIVVLFDAGGDREDVGVEDDVFGRKAHAVHQQAVSALADRGLAREGVGLALLVEGHDDRRRAVAPAELRLADELALAFLQRDRVDDALALHTLEPGFDDAPLRAVDHHRHARDVGFAGNEVQIARHAAGRVQHRLVHVDVDDLGAVFDLLARYGHGFLELLGEDQAREGLRAGHVGALADVDEETVVADLHRLEPGELHQVVVGRHDARR